MEKKIRILMFQKVAKTGNIGGKSPVAELPSNRFVPLIQFFLYPNNWGYHGKCGIMNGTYESGLITSFNRCFNLESIILGYYFLTRTCQSFY